MEVVGAPSLRLALCQLTAHLPTYSNCTVKAGSLEFLSLNACPTCEM